MTKHYEITKQIRRVMKGNAQPNTVVFCIGSMCNQVRYDNQWMIYRNLQGIEKAVLSSSLCPRCDLRWRQDFRNRLRDTYTTDLNGGDI